MHGDSRWRVVFLDAGTLPCGLSFPPALAERIDYQAHDTTAPSQVAERVAQADVLIVNKVKLTAEVLAAAPRLRRICVAAAGTDNVDKAAAAARGIEVFNVPDYGSEAVAEHAMTLLLALRKHLLDHARAAVDGRWVAAPAFCWHGPRIRSVRGTVLGVAGRGRIGEAMAELGRGMGMTVLFLAREGRPARADERPLREFLASVDALSLHLPLNEDTRGLINAERLSWMKPDAVLVNTGRGAVVDAAALVAALKAGALAGAGIDVLDVEPPPPNHPLLAADVPHLIVTPHVAWAADTAQQALAERLVQRVAELLSGDTGPAA